MERSAEYYQALSAHLPSYLLEWEWAEFKVKGFGEDCKYISAMSNEATLCDWAYGYIAWGIKDWEGSLNIEKTKRGLWSLNYGLTGRLTRKSNLNFMKYLLKTLTENQST